jgi:hypothetical protein
MVEERAYQAQDSLRFLCVAERRGEKRFVPADEPEISARTPNVVFQQPEDSNANSSDSHHSANNR